MFLSSSPSAQRRRRNIKSIHISGTSWTPNCCHSQPTPEVQGKAKISFGGPFTLTHWLNQTVIHRELWFGNVYFLFQFVILITIIIDETSVLAVISFLLAFTIYLLRFYILFCDSAILNSFTQFLFARVWTLLIGTRKKTEKIEEIKAVLQSKGEPDWSNCCQFYM